MTEDMKSTPIVYLAGPISGCTYDGCTSWREKARELLANHGIAGVSPMRHKEYLLDVTRIDDEHDDFVLSTQKAIMCRDRNDVMRCDGMLAYFNEATKPSVGTCIEYGWADAWRKPIVTVMESGNIHDHSMIREASGFIVPTLEEAVWVLSTVLGV